MQSKHESKLNMYRSVEQLCRDNNITIAGNPAFVTAFNSFQGKISDIIDAATNESQVITGIATDKSVAKADLIQMAADIAGIVFAYASSINNNTLKQSVNYSLSDLRKLKDDLVVPTVTNISKAANTNIGALGSYGITAAMLTDLDNLSLAYSTAVPKPKTAKSVKSSYTDNIKTLIKEADAILKEQMDKIVTSFKSADALFVRAYTKARVIIDPAQIKTQIKGYVLDQNGVPVKTADVAIEGITITSVQTDIEGVYSIKPVVAGTYKFTFSRPGFVTYVQEGVVVKMGHVTHVNATLTEV